MMVNNSTIINKKKNQLSPQLSDHIKDHYMWYWKSRSWLGTGAKMWQG